MLTSDQSSQMKARIETEINDLQEWVEAPEIRGGGKKNRSCSVIGSWSQRF